jgi:hypothetical protein
MIFRERANTGNTGNIPLTLTFSTLFHHFPSPILQSFMGHWSENSVPYRAECIAQRLITKLT